MNNLLTKFIVLSKVKNSKLCEKYSETSLSLFWRSFLPGLFYSPARTKLPYQAVRGEVVHHRHPQQDQEGEHRLRLDSRFLFFLGVLVAYISGYHLWMLPGNDGLPWGPYEANSYVSGFQTFINTVAIYSLPLIPWSLLYVALKKGRGFIEAFRMDPRLYAIIGAVSFHGFELAQTLPIYILHTSIIYKYSIALFLMFGMVAILVIGEKALTFLYNHRWRSHAARIKGLASLEGDHNKEIYQEAEQWEQLV